MSALTREDLERVVGQLAVYDRDTVGVKGAVKQILANDQAQRQTIAELLDALKPFAERWRYFETHPPAAGGEWEDHHEYADSQPSTIYLGQLKAAARAIAQSEGRPA